MVCGKAALALFKGFRGDPLASSLLRAPSCLYAFFELLASLARLGPLELVCVEERGATASAALLATGREQLAGRLEAGAAAKLLALLASCLKLRGVLLLAGSVAWLPRYRLLLRRVEGPCHLLFIASLLPGRGYGSKLLEIVEGECRRLGRRAVVLEVDLENRALMFYARRGYAPLAVTKFAGRDFLLMVKPLPPAVRAG